MMGHKAGGILGALTTPVSIYQVTYRISHKETASGTSGERYARLVKVLEGFRAVEPGSFSGKAHTSTSAWIVPFAGTAQDLLQSLQPFVAARFDMLEIIEVVSENHARLPPPDKA